MTNSIFGILCMMIGSFVIWMTKGFKGRFDNEIVSVDERHSKKAAIRYFLGLGILILSISIISVLLTRPTESKSFRVIKMNEKGEIIELEEID